MAVVPIKEDGSEVTDNDNASVVDPESLVGRQISQNLEERRDECMHAKDISPKENISICLLGNACFRALANIHYLNLPTNSINVVNIFMN